MAEDEDGSRRGRPRIQDEDRKRQTITFRVKEEVREALEEAAKSNRRTLSEQVYYYVEAALSTDAKMMYQYYASAMPPALRKYIKSQSNKSKPELDVGFEHEYVFIEGEEIKSPMGSDAAWEPPIEFQKKLSFDRSALLFAKSILAASQKGALEALIEITSPAVALKLLEAEAARINDEIANLKAKQLSKSRDSL